MYRKIKILSFYCLLFLIGIAIGKWVLGGTSILGGIFANGQSCQQIRESGYKFISPLLECEVSDKEMGNINTLRENTSDFVEQQLSGGIINNISVYFRDLNNGPWFGIGETEDFSPASLLKLPLLIAYFKKAESDPGILDQKITFNGPAQGSTTDAVPNFPPSQAIESGKTYTVEELLYRMIVYSDNDAKNLLLDNIDAAFRNLVYKESGINMPDQQEQDFMNVKDYASIFRLLYNASYLNKEMSERALELLSETEFKEGIVAGVEPNIRVAHKFGERTYSTPEGLVVNQFHDCGIIYYPNHPYLLCIMTKGENFSQLVKVVQSISSLIYKEVYSRYGLN